MFLTRKINRPKWDSSEGLDENEVAADTVTADMKTHSNTLSFWITETEEIENLKKAVLALASSGDRIDKIDIAWVNIDDVKKQDLETKQTRGDTPVASLQNTHVDVKRLDAIRLAKIAKIIFDSVRAKQYKRFAKAEVEKILLDAIKNGKLEMETLSDDLKKKVAPKLGQTQ